MSSMVRWVGPGLLQVVLMPEGPARGLVRGQDAKGGQPTAEVRTKALNLARRPSDPRSRRRRHRG
jgi:hypothetical protein